MIADLLGVPRTDRERFQEWSRAVARGIYRFYSGGEASGGLREIGAYFLGLIQQRRDTAGEDLVRRLLDAKHLRDRLSDLEVVAMCTALVFGGHETTVYLIGSGVLALLQEPDTLDRLRADPRGAGSTLTSRRRRPSRPPGSPARGGLPEEPFRALVHDHTEGREYGLLGEPRVNVLRLNLAPDAPASR